MSTNEQLLQQIDDLVASKTFGLDALEGIKKIKDSLKATLGERDDLQRLSDELYETSIRKDEEIRRQSGVIADLGKQLADAKALNEAGQKAIYDADKHKAVAEAWQGAMATVWQGAMATVFKPNSVREDA